MTKPDYYNELCAECGHKRLHHRADIKESPDYAPCHVLQPKFCKCDGFRAKPAEKVEAPFPE